MVQNSSARLIARIKKHDHITPMLMELHWLPVQARIEYKICIIVFNCLHGKAPLYLQELITPYQPPRPLRSADLHMLTPPGIKECKQKRAGMRSFKYAGVKLWNNLPLSLRSCTILDAFKKKLKTHLFKENYNP